MTDLPLSPAASQAGPVFQASVILQPADIRALFSRPVTIIAAPGAGKFIHVLGTAKFYVFATAVYTNCASAGIYYGPVGNSIAASTAAATLLAAASSGCAITGGQAYTGDPASLINQPVVIGAPQNPAGATAAGRLKVILTYTIEQGP